MHDFENFNHFRSLLRYLMNFCKIIKISIFNVRCRHGLHFLEKSIASSEALDLLWNNRSNDQIHRFLSKIVILSPSKSFDTFGYIEYIRIFKGLLSLIFLIKSCQFLKNPYKESLQIGFQFLKTELKNHIKGVFGVTNHVVKMIIFTWDWPPSEEWMFLKHFWVKLVLKFRLQI